MRNHRLIPFALSLLIPALTFAQTPPAGGDIQKDKADIKQDQADIAKDVKDLRADQAEGKDLEKDRNAAFKALGAKEKAAADAIRDDKSLTPEQKKDRFAALRADTKKQRDAIQDKFVADKKALHQDVKKDKADLRKDKHDLRADRRDLHRDRTDLHRDRAERNAGKH